MTITRHPPRRLSRRSLGVGLVAAAAAGALAAVPYQLAVSPETIEDLGVSTAAFAALTVASAVAVASVAVVAGLSLGSRVGLGAPLLHRLVAGDVEPGTLGRAVRPAVAVGAGLGALAVAVDLALASSLPAVDTGDVPLVLRWVASLYGAINEELLLRLGVVTTLVWAGTRLLRRTEPTSGIRWTAVVLAAVGFGLAHLPATAAVVELTPLVVGRTVGLNALLGIGFGALYLRSGLLAAMTAHLAADLVIQTAAHLLT